MTDKDVSETENTSSLDWPTVAAYDRDAASIATLHDTLIPAGLYRLIQRFFHPAGLTADIGCGAGRDCNWLYQHGYHVSGYDASEGMLVEARHRYPALDFHLTWLPELATVPNQHFANVLCSAVLMHVPAASTQAAFRRLLSIARPGGVVAVSFRGTQADDNREDDKLYNPLDPGQLIEWAKSDNALLLLVEADWEVSRNLLWHSLVFRTASRPEA